jgi:hypothetical protein
MESELISREHTVPQVCHIVAWLYITAARIPWNSRQ